METESTGAPGGQMAPAKDWCFTVNNYEEVAPPPALLDACDYMIVGEETGEEGTPHLQCFAKFTNKIRLTGIRNLTRDSSWCNAHWEKRRGTLEQAIAYCRKEGQYDEYGDVSLGSGEAPSKWRQAWDLASQGGAAAVADNFPEIAVRNYAALQQIRQASLMAVRITTRLGAPCGLWVTGSAGTGKSHLVDSLGDVFRVQVDSPRLDGYSSQKVVLWEDLDPSAKLRQHLQRDLKLAADVYPWSISQIYMGTREIRPLMAAVTSQYTIPDIFPDVQTRQALWRRYDTITVSLEMNNHRRYRWMGREIAGHITNTLEFDNLQSCCAFLRARFGLDQGETPNPQPPAPETPASVPGNAVPHNEEQPRDGAVAPPPLAVSPGFNLDQYLGYDTQ